jgi:hypothetical protein
MKAIAKIGAAGALAMGFGVAHATIDYPASNTDVLLFAEVLNGTSVVGSYAGDSGIKIGSTLSNGTVGNLSTATDSNLASLLALATGTNTIEWAVQGGNVTESGVWTSTDQFVTTVGNGGNVAQLSLRTGTNTTAWSTGLTDTIQTIDNTNLASTASTSVFATSIAAGGIWDASQNLGNSNLTNWFGQGTNTAQTGLSSTTLYQVGEGAGQTSPLTVAGLGTLTLTSTGLSFAANSSGTTVPLPAAVWLLGSGLLGLAGVGRRKLAAV